MARVEQGRGSKGSLKWIQKAVNEQWPSLIEPILSKLGAENITWRSPLQKENFAEYRDGDFLRILGLAHLEAQLSEYWPKRGPQWDALATSDRNQVLLVEAKAHVGEMCSPGTSASKVSRNLIEQRLRECAARLGANARADYWPDMFYQLANRLAHLDFLRGQGIDAYLVLVNFLNDKAMNGPQQKETWLAAYQVAFHVLGIGQRHALSPFIIEVFPDVAAHE